ncbi:hypothetical protein H072_9480 [Dactylellina haptotyla CBS 200.50]|uniref:ERCC4 domain-containing protein n=1 Tax=Dactylellina haptotyla (strain CBS 200.50) TaxID=1284197 RepID=S8BCL0_DACHA|nr:hypothetical protein H072_9480 [Dactylellina haptotyla CBS 200.50]
MERLEINPPIKLSLPLTYQQEIFREAYRDDSLFIIASGLGSHQIVANLLHSYDAAGKNFVILVGATESDNTRFGEELAEKAAISRSPNARGLVVVNTDVTNVGSREKMYSRGGVFTVTSRILVVDLLTGEALHIANSRDIPLLTTYPGLLNPTQVSGLIVMHADRVTTTSLEAFIVRIYRQKNRYGFVKAFSENPGAFASGFSPLSTVMRSLFIQKSSLWPRYHVRVAQSLEAHNADVIELEVSMTPSMQTIQNAILQCIEISISELRKANAGLDIEDWSVDSALHRSFDIRIRKQLDPVWHRVSSRTRQIASDLTTLRTILIGPRLSPDISRNLLSLDAVSFHQYLETILASHAPQNNLSSQIQSPWLFLDAADILFSTARKRVYKGDLPSRSNTKNPRGPVSVLEEQPKWKILMNILDEISQARQSTHAWDSGRCTLIMCQDRQTCAQLAEYLQLSDDTFEENTGEISSSTFMHRKYLAFRIWKNDLANFRASSKPQEHRRFSASTNGVPARKAPTNKRRRLRGAAQFAATVRDRDIGATVDKSSPGNTTTEPRNPDDLEESFGFQILEPFGYLHTEFKMHEPTDSIVIHPYSTDSGDNLLEELRPHSVIMYNPDATFVRRIERANMAVALTNESHIIEDPQEHFLRTLNTRVAGGGRLVATAEPPRLVVDIREFRSSLPSLLHGKNITIVPCTLTVGDYILTPNICVERKSIKDLISSFKDGRLYSQAEAMTNGYQDPVLLIEFDQDKSFNLEPFMDLGTAASANQTDLQAKIVLLTLHFPKLRIIWSSSPYQTAEIFEELKRNQGEPDPVKSLSIGLENWDNEFSIYSPTAMEMLKALPGINNKNNKNLLLEIDSMLEVSNADEKGLIMLIGDEAGRKVHGFFNTDIYRPRL